MDAVVPNKCYNCGKVFRDESDFNRHQNRKTPCLIRDIAEHDLKNPNRCIYCNKILSKRTHLERHLKTCKVKNGGMNMLFEKVRHEETIRIMREEHIKEKEETGKLFAEMRKEMDDMRKEMNELRKNTGATVNNGVIVHGNVTIINNIDKPRADHLIAFESLKRMLVKYGRDLPVEIILNIYFDPSHPENSSVHLIDKETKHVIAMENGVWTTFSMESVIEKLRIIGYGIAANGFRMLGDSGIAEQLKFAGANFEYIKQLSFQLHKDHEAIYYESNLIKEKLFAEFDNSSKHPAVIAENQKRRRATTAAKTK